MRHRNAYSVIITTIIIIVDVVVLVVVWAHQHKAAGMKIKGKQNANNCNLMK